LNPRSWFTSERKLCIKTPAPLNRTRESVTSQTTSAFRNPPWRAPISAPFPDAERPDAMSRRLARTAGATPKITAVSVATPKLKSSTEKLISMTVSLAIPYGGMNGMSAATPA
jgi:hypothetical protein